MELRPILASRECPARKAKQLFLDGTTYEPLFGRDVAFGSDIKWHRMNKYHGLCERQRSRSLDVREDSAQSVAASTAIENFASVRPRKIFRSTAS